MRHARLLSAAIAAGAIVVAGCARTDGTNPAAAEDAGERSSGVGAGGAGASLSTAEFVRDVAFTSTQVLELSRMALDNATDPAIKTFAQQVIDDHARVVRDVKSALSGQPIEWPTQLDEQHRKTIDDLAKASGASFDHEYVKAMVEGHQNLAATLESRLDVQSLADWKTAAAARTNSEALPDPDVSLRDVHVRPIESDDEVATAINTWAADTYPVVQQHLDTARRLERRGK